MSNIINIEKIKFGDQVFDLVVNGVNLGEDGGNITFLPGSSSFEEIESLLKTNGGITQIGLNGGIDWNRSDLVYAGRLSKQSNHAIGLEDDGVTEVKADVMVAEFRTPDVREQIAETNAKLLYLSMMTGIEMEGLGL